MLHFLCNYEFVYVNKKNELHLTQFVFSIDTMSTS